MNDDIRMYCEMRNMAYKMNKGKTNVFGDAGESADAIIIGAGIGVSRPQPILPEQDTK